ncbi:MAG: hypothetical protein CM1200mP34_1880 [Verrucomicrobiales bacterium]|nr:MAG: hypothetical protein CM1200mP34_1880 [Verrucomicrobiales bacterium]
MCRGGNHSRTRGGRPGLSRSLLTVFLCPPSLEELENRLRARGTDTEEAIRGRLAIAKDELEKTGHFEHTFPSQTREADVGGCSRSLRMPVWAQARSDPDL